MSIANTHVFVFVCTCMYTCMYKYTASMFICFIHTYVYVYDNIDSSTAIVPQTPNLSQANYFFASFYKLMMMVLLIVYICTCINVIFA